MTQVLPNFPYQGLKLTPQQKDDLTDRIEALRFALTDMVGLSGYQMCLDEGSIANIAGHLALAGAALDDDRALIWGRTRTDENAMFRDSVEWLVKADTPPPEPDAVDPAVEQAKELKSRIDQQLSPAARAELARIFAADYQHTKDGEQ